MDYDLDSSEKWKTIVLKKKSEKKTIDLNCSNDLYWQLTIILRMRVLWGLKHLCSWYITCDEHWQK